jgi:hypothetical protein
MTHYEQVAPCCQVGFSIDRFEFSLYFFICSVILFPSLSFFFPPPQKTISPRPGANIPIAFRRVRTKTEGRPMIRLATQADQCADNLNLDIMPIAPEPRQARASVLAIDDREAFHALGKQNTRSPEPA